MIEAPKRWVLERSDETHVMRIGTYSSRDSASEAMWERAIERGEALDLPDDSGNDELVYDAQILDADGEWVYDSFSYIIRELTPHD